METKKGTAATRAKNKYRAKTYDRVEVTLPKGQKEKIKAYAQEKGISLNAYIVSAIEKDMGNKSSEGP